MKYKITEIAPNVGITQYMDIAEDFIPKILGIRAFLITDESSINDFDTEIDKIYEKVKEIYKVDVSDIENGNLIEIFKRIRILGNFI